MLQSSTIPLPPREQLYNGYCSNKHTHSFGFDSQTRGTRENRAPPCVKVPGSSRVPVRDGPTSSHWPRLVVSRSTCPPFPPTFTVLGGPPPREQLCNRYFSNKHTHTPREQLCNAHRWGGPRLVVVAIAKWRSSAASEGVCLGARRSPSLDFGVRCFRLTWAS